MTETQSPPPQVIHVVTKDTKSVGMAIVLSCLYPGLGQLYAGHIAWGLTVMFISATIIGAAVSLGVCLGGVSSITAFPAIVMLTDDSAAPPGGGAVARRFAREGYVACVVRRSGEELEPLCAEIRARGGQALAFGVDARSEDEVVGLFERIEREVGPVEVAVHNIGANVSFPIRENFPQIVEERGEEALLQPDAIAESYWQLHIQPRSAWTHELDLRPHVEPW